MTRERLDIPVLGRRFSVSLVSALIVVGALGSALMLVTSLGSGRYIIAGACLAVVALGIVVPCRRAVWMEGTRLTVRHWRAVSIDLASATTVALFGDHDGGVRFIVSAGGPTARLKVLQLGRDDDAGLRPVVLLALADALAAARTPDARRVASALRGQAAHLGRPGMLAGSPLSRLTTMRERGGGEGCGCLSAFSLFD